MTVEVTLSPKEFKRFSLFDAFRRRKMWRAPATFAGILCPCGLVCFLMHHVDGAVMLGCVLCLVGLGMPAAYYLSFQASLNRQAQALGLPKTVYTLELDPAAPELTVTNGQERAQYPWKKLHQAYRAKTAVYLFITPQRGFILPNECAPQGGAQLWTLITQKTKPQQRTDLTNPGRTGEGKENR